MILPTRNSVPSDSCSVLVLQTWTLCLFVMRRSHLHYRFLYKQDIILVQCACFISSYCVPAKGSVTLEHMVTIDIVWQIVHSIVCWIVTCGHCQL